MTLESREISTPEFDTGEKATIASGMKIHAKLGRVVVKDGHLGLIRENGDLIDSAPMSQVVLKKSLIYVMVPRLHVILDGNKFNVDLNYAGLINLGYDDDSAKKSQRAANKSLAQIVRKLGGKAAGL